MNEAIALACPNCGLLTKRFDKQEYHNARCQLLPRVEEMISMIAGGATARSIAVNYSTKELIITETFVHNIFQRVNLSVKEIDSNSDPVAMMAQMAELMEFHATAVPCSRCGVLTVENVKDVPVMVSGEPQWFLRRTPSKGMYEKEELLTWHIRGITDITSTTICQMCYQEAS